MRTFGPVGALLSALAAVTVAVAVVGLYLNHFAVQVTRHKPGDMMSFAASYGDALALAGILGALAGCLALVLLALMRGIRLADQWPMSTDWRQAGRWLIAAAALFAIVIVLKDVWGDDRESVFELAYRSSSAPLLFWLAVAVMGPVFEELVVRGLLLPAFRRTRLGVSGAVIVTAIGWALAHAGRHPVDMASIFVFGLVLGAARVSTSSLSTPIAMHMAWNGAICAALAAEL